MPPDISEWPLDDEQELAVSAEEPVIAVLAGPGSGKTRTLSYRARYLLESDGKASALLLTFTNKAAAEMKARALEAGALASSRIQANTFHAFGARMLRNHGHLVGIEAEFDFLDDVSQRDLANQVAADSELRERLRRWQYLRVRRENPDPETAAFGEAFEQAKRDQGVVDYDDLVVYTADLLEAHPDVVAAYAQRYSHVLVDEFQDTNAAQFAIVRALAADAETISVFADDDQAIFRFAGAELGNVAKFVEELEAKDYPLTRNYRCARAIVDAANALIACDEEASGRRMKHVREGGEIRVVSHANINAEATALADEIEGRISDGTPAGRIAVLVRAGYRAENLVEELRRRGLPLSDWRGTTYEPKSKQALASCLALVRGRISDRQAAELGRLLDEAPPDERVSTEFLDGLTSPAVPFLSEAFDAAQAGAAASDVAAKAHEALACIDAAAAAEAEQILEAIADFEAHDPDFSLDDLLAELALGGGGRPPTSGSGIKVASLHKTKGLQWPVVYMIGMEQGLLPDYRTEENPLREERRLCFVGICRAEDVLVLSWIRAIGRHAKTPSCFIGEMGA